MIHKISPWWGCIQPIPTKTNKTCTQLGASPFAKVSTSIRSAPWGPSESSLLSANQEALRTAADVSPSPWLKWFAWYSSAVISVEQICQSFQSCWQDFSESHKPMIHESWNWSVRCALHPFMTSLYWTRTPGRQWPDPIHVLQVGFICIFTKTPDSSPKMCSKIGGSGHSRFTCWGWLAHPFCTIASSYKISVGQQRDHLMSSGSRNSSEQHIGSTAPLKPLPWQFRMPAKRRFCPQQGSTLVKYVKHRSSTH